MRPNPKSDPEKSCLPKETCIFYNGKSTNFCRGLPVYFFELFPSIPGLFFCRKTLGPKYFPERSLLIGDLRYGLIYKAHAVLKREDGLLELCETQKKAGGETGRSGCAY